MKEFSEEMFEKLFNNKAKFSIIEEGTDINIQIEFLEFLEKNRPKPLTSEEVDILIKKLASEESIESKKKTLIRLSISEEVKAYRAIEKYLESPDEELIQWSKFLLQQSRVTLESSLSGEQKIYIMSGMGGQGNKMRFLGVISKIDKREDFTDFQKDLLSKELKFSFDKNEIELEKINFYNNFVALTFLMPLDINIKKIVKAVIKECNLMGNFLSEKALITNEGGLNEEKIRELIEKYPDVKDNEKESDFL